MNYQNILEQESERLENKKRYDLKNKIKIKASHYLDCEIVFKSLENRGYALI